MAIDDSQPNAATGGPSVARFFSAMEEVLDEYPDISDQRGYVGPLGDSAEDRANRHPLKELILFTRRLIAANEQLAEPPFPTGEEREELLTLLQSYACLAGLAIHRIHDEALAGWQRPLQKGDLP